MSQSLSQLWIHIIFSTKNRYPFLYDISLRQRLYAYIQGICKTLESPVMAIGGIEDHLHLLVNTSKNISLSKFIEEIKKSSSKWIKTASSNDVMLKKFYWQNGYAAFSVSHSNLTQIKNYITSQVEHHKTKPFLEEFKLLCARHQILLDERYL